MGTNVIFLAKTKLVSILSLQKETITPRYRPLSCPPSPFDGSHSKNQYHEYQQYLWTTCVMEWQCLNAFLPEKRVQCAKPDNLLYTCLHEITVERQKNRKKMAYLLRKTYLLRSQLMNMKLCISLILNKHVLFPA